MQFLYNTAEIKEALLVAASEDSEVKTRPVPVVEAEAEVTFPIGLCIYVYLFCTY